MVLRNLTQRIMLRIGGFIHKIVARPMVRSVWAMRKGFASQPKCDLNVTPTSERVTVKYTRAP